MKSMPDDCSTTPSSVLHQNGSPYHNCAGNGVIKKNSKTERKKIPKHLFSPERGSYSDCSLRVGQNCQYLTFGA